MKHSHFKPLIATMVFVVVLGASFISAASDRCDFAYDFCMPSYYMCLASGTPQSECHAELDACIVRNGCSTAP